MEQFDSIIKEIFNNYCYEVDVDKAVENIKHYKKFVIFGVGQLGYIDTAI